MHRLGRTARAGAEGHGILILADFETHFLRNPSIQAFNLYSYPQINLTHSKGLVEGALDVVTPEAKAQAYQAWLGYYKSHIKSLRWSELDLVKHANEYASQCLRYGPEPPGLMAKTVGMMGLKKVPGLNVIKSLPAREGNGEGHRNQGKRAREGEGHSELSRSNGVNGVRGRGVDGDSGGLHRGDRSGRGGVGGGRGGWGQGNGCGSRGRGRGRGRPA